MMKESKEILELSKKLGFERTLFLDSDFGLVEGKSKKELLTNIQKIKNKKIIYRPPSEELLRFALEKTKINLVFGLEEIHQKEDFPFIRSGLDQILCQIAAEKEKTIGFSFSSFLNSNRKEKLISRMKQNINLCKKYTVQIFFSSFAQSTGELRPAGDLVAFLRVLGGRSKEMKIFNEILYKLILG